MVGLTEEELTPPALEVACPVGPPPPNRLKNRDVLLRMLEEKLLDLPSSLRATLGRRANPLLATEGVLCGDSCLAAFVDSCSGVALTVDLSAIPGGSATCTYELVDMTEPEDSRSCRPGLGLAASAEEG